MFGTTKIVTKPVPVLLRILKIDCYNGRLIEDYEHPNQWNIEFHFDDGRRTGYGFYEGQTRTEIAIALMEIATELIKESK